MEVQGVPLFYSCVVFDRGAYNGAFIDAVVKLTHLKASVDVKLKTAVSLNRVVDLLFKLNNKQVECFHLEVAIKFN